MLYRHSFVEALERPKAAKERAEFRLVSNAPSIGLGKAVIGAIKQNQRHEQSYVCFGQSVSKQVGPPVRQSVLQNLQNSCYELSAVECRLLILVKFVPLE